MSCNKLIYLILIVFLISSCQLDNAEELYPSNDIQALEYYNDNLKTIIDNKCISCHIYHIEGANKYDNYEKTKSNIIQMIERINATSNIVMPPADEAQLSQQEKTSFQDFFDILNSDTSSISPIQVNWTAYKYPDFNNRAPVSGSFNTVVTYQLNATSSNSQIDILDGATVTIDASSVNVGNEPVRTQNVASFFAAFTTHIKGTVNSYNSQSANVTFNMNGVNQQVDLDIIVAANKITLSGVITDMNLFNWQYAYDVFDSICGDYHENKLWEDISISIEIATN